MDKKIASENLQYIQSNEYKDMKKMFPLDETADNQPNNPKDTTKTTVDKKDK